MRLPSLARRTEHGKSAFLLVLALAGLAAPIFLAAPRASSEGSPSPTPAVVQSVPQDTAFLFGPRRFNGMAGGTAVYAERFVVVTSFAAGYTLRSENGALDGTGRVDSALVILNDDPILTPADYAGGDRVLTRPVTLVPEDTLVVVVYGSSGTFLDISVYTTPDPSFTVYGPRKVEIVSGSRLTVTDSFPLPAGAAPKYRLHLVNGEPDGSKRVADAVVTLNGVDVVESREIGRTYEKVVKDVSLLSFNRLSVRIQSNLPAHVTIRFTATDSVAPVLTIDAPAEGAAVGALEVDVSGTIQDQTATRVTVNGVQATVTNNASYAATVPLPVEGANALQVTAIDAAGNQTDSTRNVLRDTQAPLITINEPADGLITKDTAVTVSGTITDLTEVMANLNGIPLTLDGAGGFSAQASLLEGQNFLTVSATDAAGNGASVTRLVIRDTQAPVLTVQQPADGATTDQDSITVSGTVVDA
ncbi:MAG: hypothetical protein ACREKI_00475, partial [Gemmatimonadota bacterium]